MSVKRTIKRGYVSMPKTRQYLLSRRYPFVLLKEGDFVDPPYAWEERDRVRSAVRYWNIKHKGCLEAMYCPDGYGSEKKPCVVVGWPVGGVHVPVVPKVKTSLP